MASQEPQEIVQYKRRVIGISWLLASVAGLIFLIFSKWNWTIGIFIGQCLGSLNFSMLCKQTSKLAVVDSDKAKGFMISGHWVRYIILGVVIYFAYTKETISFIGFLIGFSLFYVAIFWDGIFGIKEKKIK